MQIVETKEKSGLPFDYLVVLDTEGLRAPEIGGSKYDHDNELATFVIGLGDATIINIKGENVTEVKDILQISVHAFLRMRMVNKAIQKNRSCIFVHQNVPALNAKMKMKHGHMKFKDNLDEMIQQAASQENISSVRTFNEVIQFDSKTHVWYFSDLWEGDLPMAAVNPGYHDKVRQVKSFILKDMIKCEDKTQGKRVFLGIPDIKQLICSMWEGVLADDFIFFFRNSLVVLSYNRLDNMFSKLHWDLEKNIRNWLSTPVSVSIANCSTEETIKAQTKHQQEQLFTVMDEYLQTALEGLEQFINKDDQKEILINWKQDKVCALKSSAKRIEEKAKCEIERMAYAQKISLLHKTDLGNHEQEIQEMARSLAATMKRHTKIEVNVLEESFQKMWSDWIKKITAQEPEEVDVWSEIQDVLRRAYGNSRRILSIELDEIKQGTWKDKIVQGARFVWRVMSNAPKPPSMEKEVDTYLQNLTKTVKPFQIEYARDVITIIVESIHTYNSNNPKCRIQKDQEIKHVVSACRHALSVFQDMQQRYTNTCSVRADLEKYKKTTRNLFENIVQQREEEVIVADYIGDQLEEPIKTAVEKKLQTKVFDHVGDLLHSKCALIRKMLEDLAEKEDFQNYQTYVYNPKVYALQWLTNFTDSQIEEQKGGQPWYVRYATEYTNDICNHLTSSVECATNGVKDSEGEGLKAWISALSKKMCAVIAVPDGLDNLTHQHTIESFENLKVLVLEKVDTVKQNVIEHFSNNFRKGIKWANKTPYEELLDSLWGCEECCPFCREPCKGPVPNHVSETEHHECIQHRPGGVRRTHWEDSLKLSIKSCNYDVHLGTGFSCFHIKHTCSNPQKTDLGKGFRVYHSSREYKQYVPHWHIQPSTDMESSHYWMWYLNKFQSQIAETSSIRLELPDIPDSWKKITKKKALASLHIYV